MKPLLENVGANLYANVARCSTCGTARPAKYFTAGICRDDWHARLEALKQPPKKSPKTTK